MDKQTSESMRISSTHKRPNAVENVVLNRWLIRICAVMIVIDLLHIPLGLASSPRFYERVIMESIPIYGEGIGTALTNTSVMADASSRGMSLPVFAVYYLGVRLLASLIFTSIGLLVLQRARSHWFGWFTAHVMLFLNGFAFYEVSQVAQLLPPAIIDLGSVFWPTVILYSFLFPNGRVVPGWMRWPIGLYGLTHLALQASFVLIQAGILSGEWLEAIGPGVMTYILLMFGLVLGCQVYRFARVSSPIEQAQTKWFILGIALILGLPLLGDVIGARLIFRSMEWGALSLTIFPITLAISILRYRLWDIDVVIRKTLQYTLLTGVLATIYFGTVVLLQNVFGQLTGDRNSPLITVISTLGIAALFGRLRRSIQEFINRRFYRSNYDSEQALARFSATARDEVDMDLLTASMLTVVSQTIHPDQASLWLRVEWRKP